VAHQPEVRRIMVLYKGTLKVSIGLIPKGGHVAPISFIGLKAL